MGKAVAKTANGKWQMNLKPLFTASLIVATLAAIALEGGALSFGQAIAVMVPASVLLVWSFVQLNIYEPAEGDGESATGKYAVRRDR